VASEESGCGVDAAERSGFHTGFAWDYEEGECDSGESALEFKVIDNFSSNFVGVVLLSESADQGRSWLEVARTSADRYRHLASLGLAILPDNTGWGMLASQSCFLSSFIEIRPLQHSTVQC